MNTWLIKKFIENYEDVKDKKVRLRYGTLAAMAGVFCNLGLFLLKLVVGLISHSVSVISDSFNNLSDAASNFLVLFSYRLSSKPADREHPFGHGRSEYLVSLFMAVVILATALELLQTSIKNIIHPATVHFEWWIFIILLSTILIKFWLSSFHGLIGRRTNNMTVLASSEDARNDMIVTSVSIVAMILSAFTEGISFDGIGGVTHTHSRWATIFAQAGVSIPILGTTHADTFFGDVPVTRKLTHQEINGEYEKETGKVIIEAFEAVNPMDIPAVIVNSHGPFTWGKDALKAVENAIVLEEVAMMAWHSLPLNSNINFQKELADKHYNRKHGANAYYGQKGL